MRDESTAHQPHFFVDSICNTLKVNGVLGKSILAKHATHFHCFDHPVFFIL